MALSLADRHQNAVMVPAATTAKPWAVTQEKVAEAVRRVVVGVSPRKLIVFGSAAREELAAANDLDLLVVQAEVVSRYAETLRLRRLLKGLLMPIDLVVTSEASFRERSLIPGTLEFRAASEGRVVHDVA